MQSTQNQSKEKLHQDYIRETDIIYYAIKRFKESCENLPSCAPILLYIPNTLYEFCI